MQDRHVESGPGAIQDSARGIRVGGQCGRHKDDLGKVCVVELAQAELIRNGKERNRVRDTEDCKRSVEGVVVGGIGRHHELRVGEDNRDTLLGGDGIIQRWVVEGSGGVEVALDWVW